MKEGDELKGDVVFELYDTFGFLVDLTALIASEQKLKVDESGFRVAGRPKEPLPRSRKITADDWKVVAESDGPTEFIGYDHTKAQVALLCYREVTAKKKTLVQAVFDRSPFYPEGGGQVGDRGTLTSDNGEAYQVLDTKKENNLIVHVLDRVPSGASFQAQVNTALRASSARNHSATHPSRGLARSARHSRGAKRLACQARRTALRLLAFPKSTKTSLPKLKRSCSAAFWPTSRARSTETWPSQTRRRRAP